MTGASGGSFFRKFKYFCKQNSSTVVFSRHLSTYFSPEPPTCADTVVSREFLLYRVSPIYSKKLVVTEGGAVGLGPKSAQEGDVVAVLHGCRTPVILRSGEDDGTFQLLGDSYFYGLMEGEAVDGALKDRFGLRDITLR